MNHDVLNRNYQTTKFFINLKIYLFMSDKIVDASPSNLFRKKQNKDFLVVIGSYFTKAFYSKLQYDSYCDLLTLNITTIQIRIEGQMNRNNC